MLFISISLEIVDNLSYSNYLYTLSNNSLTFKYASILCFLLSMLFFKIVNVIDVIGEVVSRSDVQERKVDNKTSIFMNVELEDPE